MTAQGAEKILHVVAAIIERQGRILLAQRGASQDQSGLWEFPGGKVEAGESQLQALQRELEEELGLACQVSDYVASSTLLQPGRRIHLHAWRVQPDAGEPQAREHAALHWVTPQQALDYPLAPADLPLLQAYLARLARFARDA